MSRVKNMHEIRGEIVFIGGVQDISDNFAIRTVVLELWDSDYRQEVAFDFVNESMSLLREFKEKDIVHISFALRGKKSIKDGKAKWWVSNRGISITLADEFDKAKNRVE